jgi:hypothetical protein
MMAQLTGAGLKALRDAAPGHVASVRRHIFDHLDDSQIEAMASIFAAIGAGLSE